ncbi:MAG: hypothetical protein JNL28_16690 [Planctomycetes bacterium]|nr:hypothetical protein [Planctomycetota bacterium]
MLLHTTTRLTPMRAGAEAGRRGTAIVPALIVVVMVATLSMIYIQVSLAKNKEQRVSVDSKRAFYMAEAGLAEGFNGLCLGKSGNVGSEETPAVFGGGLFWTVANELGGGRVALQSTGLCGAGRATLALTCEREPNTIGALGFFADQDITVEAGALIDSYDSRLGTYAAQAPLAPLNALVAMGAKVGGNSDIHVTGTIGQPARIYGDVKPGNAGTLFRNGLTTVVGSTAPNVARVSFPPVKVPTVTLSGDIIASGVGSPVVVPSGVHGINSLRAANNTTVSLTGPSVIVVQRLVLDANATLKIDSTDGPVNIFVIDGIKMHQTAEFSTVTPDPRGTTIQVAATVLSDLDADGTPDPVVTLSAKGHFYGSIYAPGAPVVVPKGLNAYGAIVAQSLKIPKGGSFHFDRALLGSADEASGAPKLLGWHIVELPDVGLVKLRFDALTEMVRQGRTPRDAKDAHFDIGEVVN